MPKKLSRKPNSNLKEVQEGAGRAAPLRRRAVSIPAPGGCCNGSSRTSPPTTKPCAAAESKRPTPRSNVVLTGDLARQEMAKLEAAAKKAKRGCRWGAAAAVKEANNRAANLDALALEGQARGHGFAKPQPSEQGLPPRRWRLLQRKQPTSRAKSTKPPQRNQKAPRSNVVLTQMRQGREVAKLGAAAKKASAMSPVGAAAVKEGKQAGRKARRAG